MPSSTDSSDDTSIYFKKQLDDELHALKKSKLYDKFEKRFDKYLNRRCHSTPNKKKKKELKLEYLKKFLDYPNDMPRHTKDLNQLYAINGNNDKIYFVKPLACGNTQNVYLGKLVKHNGDTAPMVLKWLTNTHRKISHEINILKKLTKMGVNMYNFTDEFKFWDKSLLCMEYLEPLSDDEDEYKVGIAVLKVLRKLHKFSIHNDIKIGNIMKKKNGEIYLIDYGGATTDKCDYGFERHCWSKKWTSQSRGSDEITTAKNDFIELGYTMRGLQLVKKGEKTTKQNVKDIKHGTLAAYMDAVFAIDEKNIPKNIYGKLINILKKH